MQIASTMIIFNPCFLDIILLYEEEYIDTGYTEEYTGIYRDVDFLK
jgi:hypothetical protein